MADDEAPPSPVIFKTAEENLLYHSRSGDYKAVTELLNCWVDKKLNLDINCKGDFLYFLNSRIINVFRICTAKLNYMIL